VVVSNTNPNLKNTGIGGTEPSISVNPSNPKTIDATAFSGCWCSGNAPLWHATDGGNTWTLEYSITPPPLPAGESSFGCPCDQTVDYDRQNRLDGTFLNLTRTDTDVYSGTTTDPTHARAWSWHTSGSPPVTQTTNRTQINTGYVDQPQLLVNRDPVTAAQDNVYVAYDDLTHFERISVAHGSSSLNFTIDKAAGADDNCNLSFAICVNPGLRLAVDRSNGTIYALWQQLAAGSGSNPVTVNYKLNRSTDGGKTWSLNGKADGIVVATAQSTQPTRSSARSMLCSGELIVVQSTGPRTMSTTFTGRATARPATTGLPSPGCMPVLRGR